VVSIPNPLGEEDAPFAGNVGHDIATRNFFVRPQVRSLAARLREERVCQVNELEGQGVDAREQGEEVMLSSGAAHCFWLSRLFEPGCFPGLKRLKMRGSKG